MKQKSACAVVVGVGAKRGIGAACCRRFAAEGMAVVVVGRSPHKIDAVAAELRADGATAMAVACDVTRPGDVERLFVAVDDAGWRPALLVYNVGNNVVKPFLKLTPEDIETTWRQCALGGFMVAQGAIPRMLEADAPSTMVFTGATASLRDAFARSCNTAFVELGIRTGADVAKALALGADAVAIGTAGGPPSVSSRAMSAWGASRTSAATALPGPTTRAGWRQPSTTWRAVIQRPRWAMEKAVPACGLNGASGLCTVTV